MTEPGKQAKTAQNPIQDTPNRIKGLNNVSNKDMNMIVNSTSKDLFNIKSSSTPSLHRAPSITSTFNRNWEPKTETSPQVASYGQKPIYDGQQEGHSKLLNLSKDTSKTIKPGNRQGLEIPPSPNIQTTSSSSLTPNNLKKIITSQGRQSISGSKGNQPTNNFLIEFLQAGFPLTRAATVEKPSFTEFLIKPIRTGQNPRPTRSKTRVTPQKRRGRNQIWTQPSIRPDQRVLTKPTPPTPNSLIPTMNNNPMNKNRKPSMKITNNLMIPTYAILRLLWLWWLWCVAVVVVVVAVVVAVVVWLWKWNLMEVSQSQSGAHTKKLPNHFVARNSECS